MQTLELSEAWPLLKTDAKVLSPLILSGWRQVGDKVPIPVVLEEGLQCPPAPSCS
jgi:hypothetical protein